MVTVFRTGHEINERVCDALEKGFEPDNICATYGVLRGSGEWAKEQPKCLLADKGYFGASHFDGTYRLSFTGTQAKFDPEACYGKRFEDLGLKTEDWQPTRGRSVLLCPPTDHVCHFYGLGSPSEWIERVTTATREVTDRPVKVRLKGTPTPFEHHLWDSWCVVTFNSGVGWEALQKGWPVYSDLTHSTLGTWLAHNGVTTLDVEKDLTHLDRTPLLNFMANRQFTLAEIETGLARSYVL